ncbi:SusC/RagA family TonB-linked outer membrane protein [Coprobacter tertius]|uniref:SusC/RagA family TonB-linked outer membrane protein n=1 Tax=Coprobacter tertius TaxID=2944915 RepID=A0ABT1MGB2_9BACT|nr:SusC/RagA family TonB-linked outer membrane protein [Coprobacter tertius]MCP9610718.1 SusC/RagA family TonB-linked outer membrane protein [Coprobacter tertius]
MIKNILITILIVCNIGIIHAQNYNILSKSNYNISETDTLDNFILTGFIFNLKGEALEGANIYNARSGEGTIADSSGHFSLSVNTNDAIKISFVGYVTQEITARKVSEIYIRLEPNFIALEDVIITALGLEKEISTLSYSAEQIQGKELNKVKDMNMLSALAGKIPGLQINKNASGLGGSIKLVLRGIRSASGNNQPLFVIDGIPILNTSYEQAYTAIGSSTDGGNRDGGDGISNLNPEDIENISILKGGAAAALYGSQAANGVILISTKSGNPGIQQISFSTSLTVDKAFCLPQFQNNYGASDEFESWGVKGNYPSYNNAGQFFNTGLTSITALTLTTGNNTAQNYFSYANTTGKGIIGNNKTERHNLNIRSSSSFFAKRLHIDANVNLIRQTIKDRPVPGGFYMNPLVGLYRFPRGTDISFYKENFETYNSAKGFTEQNWISGTQDFEQNPYWIINRIHSKSSRNRALVSLAIQWDINRHFRIKARGSYDYASDMSRQESYASTAPALAGENGRYEEYSYLESQRYGDIIGQYNNYFGIFSLNADIGASVNDTQVNSIRYDSKNASLKYPNVFTLANINMSGAAYISQQIEARKQLQSVFGTFQIGIRNEIYFDASFRNDWSSTLAFTPHLKKGFFYPSAGASWLMNKTFNFPEKISLSKIRISWSQVGNDIPLFITHPVSHLGAGGNIQLADAAAFNTLKPERTKAIEIGTEWKFFDNRLDFNITVYQTNTHNQVFKLPAQTGDIYAYRYANAGNIRNRGIEFSIGGNPVSTSSWDWDTRINFSMNRNKIIRLHDELPMFLYGPYGFSSSYAMRLKEGGSFGDIYGKAFRRDDNGNILYETSGEHKDLPLVDGEGNTIKVGNCMPRFLLSWANNISFGNVILSLLIDGRFGGKVLSQTQADMDQFGVTKATGDARNQGYVNLEGHKITNIKGFYKNIVGGRSGVTEYYMYNATNIRLRELSVGYSLPDKLLRQTRIFKQIQFSFIARNLFFLFKKAPFDPELVLSTGNDNQGIDSYGMPTTRSFGFSIKCEI